jgi:hypothetical protein
LISTILILNSGLFSFRYAKSERKEILGRCPKSSISSRANFFGTYVYEFEIIFAFHLDKYTQVPDKSAAVFLVAPVLGLS